MTEEEEWTETELAEQAGKLRVLAAELEQSLRD